MDIILFAITVFVWCSIGIFASRHTARFEQKKFPSITPEPDYKYWQAHFLAGPIMFLANKIYYGEALFKEDNGETK